MTRKHEDEHEDGSSTFSYYEKVRDGKDSLTGKPRRAKKKINGVDDTIKGDWYGRSNNEHMVSRSGAKLYEAIKEAEQAIEKELIANRSKFG
jgi:hypothetical protein